jgi:hypothetical protein
MKMSKIVKSEIKRGTDVIKLVFEISGGEGFIAGGFARYCLSNLTNPSIPGDIDLFCHDEKTYERILERFSNHPKCVKKSNTTIETKFEYRINSGYHQNGYSIQLIKPIQILNMVSEGGYTEILSNFDFTVSKAAILPTLEAFVWHSFHDDDACKALIVDHIHCPISSMKRVIKYTQKGFSIESVELLKLFEDYEKRSERWKNIVKKGLTTALETLEEQKEFAQTMYMD